VSIWEDLKPNEPLRGKDVVDWLLGRSRSNRPLKYAQRDEQEVEDLLNEVLDVLDRYTDSPNEGTMRAVGTIANSLEQVQSGPSSFKSHSRSMEVVRMEASHDGSIHYGR
jgi:hypothetical protein